MVKPLRSLTALWMRRVAMCAAALAFVGCELTSTSLTEPEDALLIEAYVSYRTPVPGVADRARGLVYIHGVAGGAQALTGPPDATVTMTTDDGNSTVLPETDDGVCITETIPSRDPGRCYYAPTLHAEVRPGSRVSLRVETADGRVVTGVTQVPRDFEILTPVGSFQTCQVPPNTRLNVEWTSSPGSWAYPSEVKFEGLRDQLQKVDPDFANLDDPLVLFGLAISDSDTTISFPNEFGLFDRFDDDELTRALVLIQEGMPDSTKAQVTISAADRNWVNWERGGNFNPSGPVRVPSVGGDGFGVFGSLVLHTFAIEVGEQVPGRQACTGQVTAP